MIASPLFEQLRAAYHAYNEAHPNHEQPDFLSQLDDEDREHLCQVAAERTCLPGEVIMREADPGDCMYIIKSGRAVILKGNLDAPMILGFRGEGGLIGEMALLENRPRSATAVALDPMTLWGISQEAFIQLSIRSPGFSLKVLGLLSARLRKSDEQYWQVFETGKQREEDLAGLRDQVMRDPLTGLYNRRSLEVTLAQKISQPGRPGGEVGILMLDVDHFKRINDTYGHPAGDAVLKALAGLLAKCVRAEDIVCRFGGEEFVVVLPGAPLSIVQERAEMIRQGFQEMTVSHQDVEIRATLSIGAAMYPAHAANGEAVLACADQALYQAKKSGRNQVVVWQKEVNLSN